MINVAVIGTGYIGKVHIETISRLPNVRVQMVVDKDIECAKAAAEKYAIPHYSNNFDEVLNEANISVIHVCTPNSFHFLQSMAALETGKHVFSEKPLAMSAEEAERLYATACAKGCITGIDFCYRYYPGVLEIKEKISKGDIGTLRMVTGSWLQDWLLYPTDYSWRLNKSESGESNVAADLGSHWFDLISFTTGLSVREVMADFKILLPERIKPAKAVEAFAVSSENGETVNVSVEEYASLLFRLENDVPGSFTACQACAGRKSETEFQLYGSESSLCWNHGRSNEIWIGHRDRPNEVLIESPILFSDSVKSYSPLPAGHPLGYYDAVLNLFSDYYRAVEKNDISVSPNLPTFYHGYREMQLLNAIVKSASSKKWVRVKMEE